MPFVKYQSTVDQRLRPIRKRRVPNELNVEQQHTPTVPRGTSRLSTDTAASLPSLENSARAKTRDYEDQSLCYDTPVQSGSNAFLTWLPEASRTSLVRDINETSSDRQSYDVFLKLLTRLAVPSKYVPFKGINRLFLTLLNSEIPIKSTLCC